MPLPDTIAVEVKSPVLGLYSNLVLPVYKVEALPVVTLANVGYKLLAVLVSLEITAPPKSVQFVPSYPSYWDNVLFQRILPTAPVGRSPVVPAEIFNAPVELNDESPEAARMFTSTVVPAESTYTARSAGWVTNTSLVPDVKLTSEPELLEARTVVRESVFPDVVYVPIPTSHSPETTLAMV
jgi:hypothetical protein